MIKKIEKKVEKYPNMKGKRARIFCLLDQNENKVCLKDELKRLKKDEKILLFFYPKDMTSGCTLEAIDFSKAKVKLKNKGVKVFGISKLTSKSKLKFIKKNNLKIDFLSDEDLKVCEKYNVYRDKSMYGKMVKGIARETFLIDKEGEIKKHWQKVKPIEHVKEILDFLKEK